MRTYHDAIKVSIGNFDDQLILQMEVDELEEVLVVPVPEGGLPTNDEGFDEPETGRGFDPLVRAEVILPHKGGDMMAKVVGRKRDANGNLVGRKHKLPVLDLHVYEVELLDGERQEISFNILAEHLLSQIDEEGNQYQIFKEIVDHRKDPKRAVDKADQFFTKGKKKHMRKTTTGWDLEVEWKDGTTSWLLLKALKETNPVHVAEYARANKIDAEPAFDWWVPVVLRRKSQIIRGAINRHQRAGYKFGI